MIDEKEFRKLKQRADDAKEAKARAAGQLDAAMSRLEEDFGCKTIKEAEKKVKQLTKDATSAEAAYETALADFEEKWGEYAGED